ncbi:endopeptidase La [Coprobacter tertius]|uniref:Lon protease n=1 Tax=Coprobacter tertius TaxID=2944915 RepID=A0ABT1MIA7_9BACT|nr:endopeptidase La [Coprobacter tertius]MCP9612151.1 endopeptidase La [Coprobacter tertius]
MKNFFNDNNPLNDNEENETTIMPIFTEIEGSPNIECSGVSETDLPILPLRNMVMYPGVALPVSVGRPQSLQLIKDAYEHKRFIGVVCQKDMSIENPEYGDLYEIGSIAEIVKILEMPDSSSTVILQGKKRFHLDNLTSLAPYLKGNITILDEEVPEENDKEFEALISALKDLTFRILKTLGEPTRELGFALRNIQNNHYLVNFLCSNIPMDSHQKQELLNIGSLKQRAFSLYASLSKEAQLIEIKADIQSKTREDINQQQREHFLQQQIKTIQDELGGSVQEQDIQELRKKAENKKWNETIATTFEKEIRKLERLHPQSPDFSVQYNYLETFVDLPWGEYTKDNFNLKHAQKQLDKDHYGLEKVKERIIEHLAVLKLRGDLKSPIICLYGPPGVGKTSLGKSIAEALKRKYIRVSLGGLHDEAEIRGHRRTYIGSMPGRIIQGLIKAGSSNPVFVLDEIDKIGNDFKGDPASALLEVLDPEQNNAFHDNYLDIDFDLSRVLFIATANNLNTISQPLLDRMELIDISGYIQEEKVEIARRHLVPKQLNEHGLKKEDLEIPKKTMDIIVESYTRESGVRELDKRIAQIMRKAARKKATEKKFRHTLQISDLHEYLGPAEYTRDKYEGNDYAGVVTGLAWTAVGGEILFVESSLSKSKNEKLTITGNLGDVMKESAVIAMQYIRSHASLFNIDDDIFEKWSVHIHVPEGAIPKDGPSAGITMATSIASSFTQRKVKPHLAMTGEITLRGRVLPVGGIKEKILAAKRANIKEIILSEENKKDIEEIKDIYLQGLTFHYVNTIKEVLDIALLNEKVKDAIKLD